jgi:hypothetical protein
MFRHRSRLHLPRPFRQSERCRARGLRRRERDRGGTLVRPERSVFGALLPRPELAVPAILRAGDAAALGHGHGHEYSCPAGADSDGTRRSRSAVADHHRHEPSATALCVDVHFGSFGVHPERATRRASAVRVRRRARPDSQHQRRDRMSRWRVRCEGRVLLLSRTRMVRTCRIACERSGVQPNGS